MTRIKSLKRKAWRNFINLCDKLKMSQSEVERLVSRKGKHIVGEFSLIVEREYVIDGQRFIAVSLWKGDDCHYKSSINPYLFEELKIEPSVN